jgi:hypothetical protein
MRRTLPLALLLLGIAALPCTAHASGLKARGAATRTRAAPAT